MNKRYTDVKNSKLFRAADVVVLALLLAAAVVLMLALGGRNRGAGERVEIYRGGALVKVMPLHTDAEYRYEYEGHYNIIVVKHGAVSVGDADCPDKICLREVPKSGAGETILCLPHLLKVKITGENGIDGTV
jgi:hypothetical protein